MSSWMIFGAQPRVQLEVALWRHGWIWLLTGLAALIALPAAVWWWQTQQQELETARSTLEQARVEQVKGRSLSMQAQPSGGDDATLAQLGHSSYADTELSSVLRSLAQIAQAQGLMLAQSDFQTVSDSHGGLRQVQLTLPVNASYPQLRRFVEEVLRRLHGVSVDHLGLKRETVSQGQIEARLKLSVWIDPFKTPASPAPHLGPDKAKDVQTKTDARPATANPVNRKAVP